MAENAKRRRKSRTAVILLNELISLKLPYPVCVVLHFLEGEAEEKMPIGTEDTVVRPTICQLKYLQVTI